jgi:hypothetical protein
MTRQGYRYMQAVQFPVVFLASTLRSKHRRVFTLSLRPPSLRNELPKFTGDESIVIFPKITHHKSTWCALSIMENSEKRPWPIKNSPSIGRNEGELT